VSHIRIRKNISNFNLGAVDESGPGERARVISMNYVQDTGKSLGVGAAVVLAVMALAVAGTVAAQAQEYNVFFSFQQSMTEPGSPSGVVAQGIDGNLYGYSDYGGTGTSCGKKGCGTIYRITPCQGCTPAAPIVLYSFGTYDNCGWGLTLGSDNNFYGACQTGGAGYGYVYQFIPNGTNPGTFTQIYIFCKNGPPCSDGAITTARPTEGRDGNYYLNTIAGGNPNCTNVIAANGCGTVFQLIYTAEQGAHWPGNVLYAFPPDNNLVNPSGVLTVGGDGNLYGTTQGATFNQENFPSCPPNCGEVYEISTAGGQKPIVLHTFQGQDYDDGATPTKGVIEGTDGSFYGSTAQGGANGLGFVYKLTTSGEVKAFAPIPPSHFDYSFTVTDAANGVPRAMTQGSDGNFYGDARDCDDLGADGCQYYEDYGGVFEITPEGTFSWVQQFDLTSGANGTNPDSKVSHTSGVLYGVTGLGGEYNDGVMYSITLNDVEQAQFCRPQVLAGQAGGAPIGILGQGFGSSSQVYFGGVPAAITSTTPTYITATIPPGAQTGLVTVTTGSTTLSSLQTFYVLPNITGFSPPSGPVGTPVTITGTGWSPKYAQSIRVTFGSVNAEFTVNSDTQVTAIVPKGAVTAPIYITTGGGTAVSASDFIVTN
jgi:uncharacterized repeat protein (TIGR03803 family)